MYILTKNISLFIAYVGILFYTFVHSKPYAQVHGILLIFMSYYGILLIPHVHQIYIYNIVERIIPKWSYLVRCSFHYLLFYPTLTKSFPAVLSVFIVMLWKDIHFLIKHAEKRLAKIEMSMYDSESPNRIAHLHLNVYTDDTGNRFHKHCFDTNRIYLIEHTQQSKQSLLSIYNYRTLQKEGKKPRTFTGDDEIHYIAANNTNIFISQRQSFLLPPLLILIWLMTMTDVTASKNMYLNHGVLLADVLSYRLGNKVNDITIGYAYLIAIVTIFIG